MTLFIPFFAGAVFGVLLYALGFKHGRRSAAEDTLFDNRGQKDRPAMQVSNLLEDDDAAS